MAQTHLPTRALSNSNALSDDEAVPDADPSSTTGLLVERLQAWKHMCGYLENYVTATEKVQRSQSKEYEKILKSVSDPLKEGHHFAQELGGVAGLFENIRSNTQGMANMHLETEKNLKGTVLPILTRLHAEIKNKTKELESGAGKSAKNVDKARNVTQRHIEMLGQHTASFDSSAGKVDQSHDPYLLQRGVNHRLNKQILEENNNRQDLISVQNSFQQFEAHVVQTIQGALNQFLQYMGGQADRHRAMYADIVSTAQNIPPEFEWAGFLKRNSATLVDPSAPGRTLSNISFPNQNHRSTHPLIEGSLERKSRGMGALKGYSSGYYAVTPAGYLHEFKDDDDFRRDPTPDLSLFLPDCTVGAIDGTKFNVKGKDVSGGKVGSKLAMTSELAFKAHTSGDAEKWQSIIASLASSSGERPALSEPVSPVESRVVSGTQPQQPQPIQTDGVTGYQGQKGALSAGTMKSPQSAGRNQMSSPTSADVGRSPAATTSPGYYQVAPGGTGVDGGKNVAFKE